MSILRILKKTYYYYYYVVLFKLKRVKFGSFSIKGYMQIVNQGGIIIGNKFKANSGKKYNPIGGDIVTRLIAKDEGKIFIGNNVGISNSTIFSEREVVIMDGVLIGGGCSIWDTDFHSLDPKIRGSEEDVGNSQPIKIKNKAFIGARSVILKGVTIGENSIVGANSVVTKSIPKNQIWAGNPARFIKEIH